MLLLINESVSIIAIGVMHVLQRGGKDPIRIRHELFTRMRKVQGAVAENMVSVYETVCWYADFISRYSYVNKINIDVNQ